MAPPPQSMQEPAPGSKSAKFIDANPLNPLINPFGNDWQGSDDQQQNLLAENVNQRLFQSMGELQEKQHRRGGINEGPMLFTNRLVQPQQATQTQQQVEPVTFKNDGESDSDDDDSFKDDDEDDPILDSIRQRRLAEIQQAQWKKAQDMARGHGQYRTISQDEFLPECTSSEYVVVHFSHADFERCKIMNHHLRTHIAPVYTECKFVCILAEKAPFFVQKLSVRTLPTIIVFRNGMVVDRLVGFEGLSSSEDTDPDAWKTSQLLEWLAKTGAIHYKSPSPPIKSQFQSSVRRGGVLDHDE